MVHSDVGCSRTLPVASSWNGQDVGNAGANNSGASLTVKREPLASVPCQVAEVSTSLHATTTSVKIEPVPPKSENGKCFFFLERKKSRSFVRRAMVLEPPNRSRIICHRTTSSNLSRVFVARRFPLYASDSRSCIISGRCAMKIVREFVYYARDMIYLEIRIAESSRRDETRSRIEAIYIARYKIVFEK